MKKILALTMIIFLFFSLSTCATGPSLLDVYKTEPIAYPADNPDDYTPGEGWELKWSDEFDDGVFDENTWTRQLLMPAFNNEWQKYTGKEETAYEENGYMILKADRDDNMNIKGHFTSARVISNPGGKNGDSGSDGKTFLYGKIAARIQLPFGKGISPVFWMVGDNIAETGGNTDYPACGSIVISTTGKKGTEDKEFGHLTTVGMIGFDGTVDNTGGWEASEYLYGSKQLEDELFAEKFHVYEIEWSEEEITWCLDGIPFHTEKITDPKMSELHLPHYVLFSIPVGGDFSYDPDADNIFPQYAYIDWIRYYKKQ